MPDAPPRAIPRDDPRLREALDVLEGVARGIGRQLGSRYPLDDLVGYGHEVVASVVERFDPDRGISFRSFARLRLRGAILDGLRKESGLPRGVAARLRALEAADLYVEDKREELGARARPTLAAQADAKLSSLLRSVATAYATGLVAREGDGPDGPEREDPETHARRAELRRAIDKALDELGDPEGTLLRRHYFLDEDLQDAAAHLGLSKSWGSRLHARAVEKLADKLATLRGAL